MWKEYPTGTTQNHLLDLTDQHIDSFQTTALCKYLLILPIPYPKEIPFPI